MHNRDKLISWHRARLPSTVSCPTSFSSGERRSCPADTGTRGIFFFLSLFSCSYSSKSPAERATWHTIPCADPGSLGRLQGLMLGQAPAWLCRRKAGSAGSQPSPSAQRNSPMAASPSCYPLSSLSIHPQKTGCSRGEKRRGHMDASNPTEL